MADDNWQLEAIHGQFDVFESLKQTYKKINARDMATVNREIAYIQNKHSTFTENMKSPRVIGAEIMKHVNEEDEIHFSFVMIILNIKKSGQLTKVPVFAFMSRGKKMYMDLDLTLFHGWEAYLQNNGLPRCDYCFPVYGLYDKGKKLKIDFASSPVSISPNSCEPSYIRALGFIAGAALAVGTFFFNIPRNIFQGAEYLLEIAKNYVPTIARYGRKFLEAVTLIQRMRNQGILVCLPELYRLLSDMNDEFKDDLSLIYEKVKKALKNLYLWIKGKLSSFFEKASTWAQHRFLAIVHRENSIISELDSDIEDILEASTRNIGVSIAQDRRTDSRTVNQIFGNAASHAQITEIVDGHLNAKTAELLDLSSNLAKQLDKKELKEVQDIFEALCNVVKYEYKKEATNYGANLKAAKVAAKGVPIDIKVYNEALGIKGDVKAYFWDQALNALIKSPLIKLYLTQEIDQLSQKEKMLILPLIKPSEDDIAGIYRCVGIDRSGKFTTQQLMSALKESEIIDLNNENLAINETSTVIMFRKDKMTLVATQTINGDNTSEGLLLIASELEDF